MLDPIPLSVASQSVIRAEGEERRNALTAPSFWSSFGRVSCSTKIIRLVIAVATLGMLELVIYCKDLSARKRFDQFRPRTTQINKTDPLLEAISNEGTTSKTITIPTHTSWVAGASLRNTVADFLNNILHHGDLDKEQNNFLVDCVRADYQIAEGPDQPFKKLDFGKSAQPRTDERVTLKKEELLNFIEGHLPQEILSQPYAAIKPADAHPRDEALQSDQHKKSWWRISCLNKRPSNLPAKLSSQHCFYIISALMHQSSLGGSLLLSKMPAKEKLILPSITWKTTKPDHPSVSYSLMKGDEQGVFLIEANLNSRNSTALLDKTSVLYVNNKEFHSESNVLIRLDFRKTPLKVECLRANCEYTLRDTEVGEINITNR